MRKVLSSLLLLILLPLGMQAVIPDIKFRRLDTRDGLSNSQVNCVYRDSRGFMRSWTILTPALTAASVHLA